MVIICSLEDSELSFMEKLNILVVSSSFFFALWVEQKSFILVVAHFAHEQIVLLAIRPERVGIQVCQVFH